MSQKIFIVHGWTYSLDKWKNLLPLLKQQDLDPVMLNVPGLTEPSKAIWDIDGYVEWLDDQLNSEVKPIVVGHSNGGRIALAYLQTHPGRFKQLILIDSAGLAHDSLKAKTKLKTLRILSKVGKPLAKIPVVKKGVYKVLGAQDYNQAPPNMRLTMQNMLNADKMINLAKITTPTTIIWGENDTATPLQDGRTMNNLLKGSTLHVVRGARHAPQHTHAREVANVICAAVKGS